MPVFRYETRLPFSPDAVFAWHERPGSFERLVPSWLKARVISRRGTVQEGDAPVFELHVRGAKAVWLARHRDPQEGRRFVDEQIQGPFAKWVHTHQCEPDGEGGTRVLDEIEWEPPGSAAAGGFAARTGADLERTFAFRARRLRDDLSLHARWSARPRLTIAVTGAHGLIGSALVPFLSAGGHRVLPIVRSREQARLEPGAIYWNPDKEEIYVEGLRGVDAVVHLAAEPIVQLPRWTEEKKKRILESRVQGTTLIAGAIAGLHERGPRTLVSNSAVGYYGDRGDHLLTEQDGRGRGFLAEVVEAWEDATKRARGAGIRVVLPRAGPVMSAAGGMLEKVLIPFKMGLGGRLGSGKQYLAWLDIDDMVGIHLHALMDEAMSGPINACAPNPVTNAGFADALGRVLERPTLVPVPSLAVKAGLGEMGTETLLYGQRAKPARLLAAGYEFQFEGIEDSLRFQLGAQP